MLGSSKFGVRAIGMRALSTLRASAAASPALRGAVTHGAGSIAAMRPTFAAPTRLAAGSLAGQARAMCSQNQTKLYVGNLSFKVGSQELEAHFSQFGAINEAFVVMDRENPGRSRGFGFVVFESTEDAEMAISKTNESEWQGRFLRVNFALEKQRQRPQFGEGGGGGGWNRGGGGGFEGGDGGRGAGDRF